MSWIRYSYPPEVLWIRNTVVKVPTYIHTGTYLLIKILRCKSNCIRQHLVGTYLKVSTEQHQYDALHSTQNLEKSSKRFVSRKYKE